MKLQYGLIIIIGLFLAPGLLADETVSSAKPLLTKKERLAECQSAVQAHFGSTLKCAKPLCTKCLLKKGKSKEDWQSRLHTPPNCLRKTLQRTKFCKVVLSPKALYDDFKKDPAAVDEKYKGKPVVIKGVLKVMAETPDGIPFANLKAGKFGLKRVILFAAEAQQKKMVAFKNGETLFAVCRGGGKYVIYPRLNDCYFL